ncbi:MAG TPA: hypothetical protein VIS72_09025 [Anaerolineales bacterium]
MNKHYWASIVILSLLISACSSAPVEPTMSGEDIQSTAVAAAFTIVAETHAANPTNTPIPPTDIPSPTSTPIDTPVPSLSAVDLSIASPTIIPTLTSQPVSSDPTKDPCDKILSSWHGPSANLNLVYEYSPQGKDDKVVVSIWVMTDQGDCGFLPDLSIGPVGQYSVAAYIDGAKNFKVFGGFRITEAAWDIVIRNDKIVALGSCYPNC